MHVSEKLLALAEKYEAAAAANAEPEVYAALTKEANALGFVPMYTCVESGDPHPLWVFVPAGTQYIWDGDQLVPTDEYGQP